MSLGPFSEWFLSRPWTPVTGQRQAMGYEPIPSESGSAIRSFPQAGLSDTDVLSMWRKLAQLTDRPDLWLGKIQAFRQALPQMLRQFPQVMGRFEHGGLNAWPMPIPQDLIQHLMQTFQGPQT